MEGKVRGILDDQAFAGTCRDLRLPMAKILREAIVPAPTATISPYRQRKGGAV